MPGMLTASGQPFSSERLLDTEFLQQAQQQLGAEKILVAAPRRTVLYAGDAALTGDALHNFRLGVIGTLQDDSFGNAVITNLLFEVTDGQVTGAQLISIDD